MITSARRAFGPSGFRKALTPLLIASKPVSDVPPFANARRITRTVAPMTRPSPWPIGDGAVEGGRVDAVQVPSSARITPTTMTTAIDTAKKYVGNAKARPASFDAAQVAVRQQQHDGDGDLEAVRAQRRDRRHHRHGAGGRLHRDRDDVVDEQRDRRDLGRPGPKLSRATTYEPPARV